MAQVSKIRYLSQLQNIVLGMSLGIVVGLILKKDAAPLEYLGIVFLHLIKLVTIPIVFFAVVYGITNIENQQEFDRLGKKAMFIFVITSIFAVLVGFFSTNLLEPGGGVRGVDILGTDEFNDEFFGKSPFRTIADIVPKNLFISMIENKTPHILFFALFVGIVLNAKRDSCGGIISFCHQSAQLFFEMIRRIMVISPIGVFGYVAAMVGTKGFVVVILFGKLVFTVLFACFLQYLAFGLILIIFVRISPVQFYKKLLGVQIITFSTSSSKATLAYLTQVAEFELGISKRSARFILPLSGSINMDGGVIYQAVCALFLAQIVGIELDFFSYITLIFMCIVASIGCGGAHGSDILFLGMVLQSVGIPLEGILVVASVDRIIEMITKTIDITGNACVTILLDDSQKKFDKTKYYEIQET